MGVVVSILTEPMFLLLALAAVAYLVFGSLPEGLSMLTFACITIGLVVFQERRGDKAIEALTAFAAPIARVIRDGVEQSIPAQDIVPGDALMIFEGERIAADGILRQGAAIRTDESVLTGESLPVMKIALPSKLDWQQALPGGDNQPFLFAGTLAVGGQGIVEVMATGAQTRTGRIGASLAAIRSEPTPLQHSTQSIVKLFGILALTVSVALVILIGWRTGDWLNGILSGLALAMAMVPEEFPMVLTIFAAIGAMRLARNQVLVRHASAVETLGAVSVLCVDKTGTLTENHIVLDAILAAGELHENLRQQVSLAPAALDVLDVSRLACGEHSADPIDRAVIESSERLSRMQAARHWEHVREYPLTPGLLAVTHVWRTEEGKLVLTAKGAPEAILSMCPQPAAARRKIMSDVLRMAEKGLRVLAVAKGVHEGEAGELGLPETPVGLPLVLLGLIAFQDPLRTTVAGAVQEALHAGVSVVMITGDHPSTALAIARAAGIAIDNHVLTGATIEGMDEAQLAEKLVSTRVFARIMPEQKLKIVRALSAHGDVVAMTGDGVNDAPALKAAHVGIAIGGSGSAVAQEAADLVLLTPRFDRIITGIRIGRQTFDNLRKVLIYVTAAHGMIFGMALLPPLLGLPLVMLPVHVVIFELVIDTTCSLAFARAPAEDDLMQRGPRCIDEPLLGWQLVGIALFQGAMVFAAAFAILIAALHLGYGDGIARSLAFIAMIAGNVTLVRVNMSRRWTLPHLLERGQGLTWLIVAIVTLAVIAAHTVPQMRLIFGFEITDGRLIVGAVMIGVLSALLFDLVKLMPVTKRLIWQGNGHAMRTRVLLT